MYAPFQIGIEECVQDRPVIHGGSTLSVQPLETPLNDNLDNQAQGLNASFPGSNSIRVYTMHSIKTSDIRVVLLHDSLQGDGGTFESIGIRSQVDGSRFVGDGPQNDQA